MCIDQAIEPDKEQWWGEEKESKATVVVDFAKRTRTLLNIQIFVEKKKKKMVDYRNSMTFELSIYIRVQEFANIATDFTNSILGFMVFENYGFGDFWGNLGILNGYAGHV